MGWAGKGVLVVGNIGTWYGGDDAHARAEGGLGGGHHR